MTVRLWNQIIVNILFTDGTTCRFVPEEHVHPVRHPIDDGLNRSCPLHLRLPVPDPGVLIFDTGPNTVFVPRPCRGRVRPNSPTLT